MWGKRKKQEEAARIPGRDRAQPNAPSAPVYSYYARRAPESRQNSQNRASQEDVPRKRSPRLHRLLLIGYAAIILVCFVKITFVIPDSKVVVSGSYTATQLPVDSYAAAADSLMRGSVLNMSKITLDTNGIARQLEQKFPELSSVVVAVPVVGNRPVVYVSASEPAFILDTNSGQYTIDTSGFVLTQATAPTNALLRLREPSNRTVTPGKQYFAASTVHFASVVAYQLQKAGYEIDHLELPVASPYELDVYLKGKPYYIRFNLQENPEQQSGGAVATLSQIGKDAPKVYLDMRTPERAYFK